MNRRESSGKSGGTEREIETRRDRSGGAGEGESFFLAESASVSAPSAVMFST